MTAGIHSTLWQQDAHCSCLSYVSYFEARIGRRTEFKKLSIGRPSNTDADWDAAPRYDFTERDIVVQRGKRLRKTYQVTMIDGSPYNKLIAVNGQRLSPAQAAAQDQKLEEETNQRRKESS